MTINYKGIDVAQVAAQFKLTKRERETVGFLVEGLTSKAIAGHMNISPNTVKAFMRLIMFRSSDRSRRRDTLSRKAMTRQTAINKMIKRRALDAGLPDEVACHSFRGTGITEYLRNGGTLEIAAQIESHSHLKLLLTAYARRHSLL